MKTNFSIPDLSEIIAKNSKKAEPQANQLLESYSHENIFLEDSKKKKIILYISQESTQPIRMNKDSQLGKKNINIIHFSTKINDNNKFNCFINRLKDERNKRLSPKNKTLIDNNSKTNCEKKKNFSEFNNELTKDFNNLTFKKNTTLEKSSKTKKIYKPLAFKKSINSLRPPDEFFEKVQKKAERLINHDNSIYKLKYLKMKKRELKKKFRPIENNFICERKKLISPKMLNQIKCENKKMTSIIQEIKSDIFMEENPICIKKLNNNLPSKTKEMLNNSGCLIFEKFKHDLSIRKNENSDHFQILNFSKDERKTVEKQCKKNSKVLENKQNRIFKQDYPFKSNLNNNDILTFEDCRKNITNQTFHYQPKIIILPNEHRSFKSRVNDVLKMDDSSKDNKNDKFSHNQPKVLILADENQIKKKKKNKTSADSKNLIKEFFNDFGESSDKNKVKESSSQKNVSVIILNEKYQKDSFSKNTQCDKLVIDDSSNMPFIEIDFSDKSYSHSSTDFSVKLATPEQIQNSPCVMLHCSPEKSKNFGLENYLFSYNNQILIQSDDEGNSENINEISFGEEGSKRRKLNFQLETLNLFKKRDFNYK